MWRSLDWPEDLYFEYFDLLLLSVIFWLRVKNSSENGMSVSNEVSLVNAFFVEALNVYLLPKFYLQTKTII